MVNLVVAFPAEANPLIGHYRLKQTDHKPFKIYQNGNLRLIITGKGREKAFQAVSFLHELSKSRKDEAWLNVGIAGHRDHEIGTGILAHKILDLKSQKSWHPVFFFKPPSKTGTVLTVDSVETSYRDDYVYEMEASGFYEEAVRHSTFELVHSYKVISDNKNSSTQSVTPALAGELIQGRLKEITFLVIELQNALSKLKSLRTSDHELTPFLSKWHFTVTETHQLRRLVRRFKTLMPGVQSFGEVRDLRTADEVLSELRNRLSQIQVSI